MKALLIYALPMTYYHNDRGIEEMVTVGRVTCDDYGIEVEEERVTRWPWYLDGRGECDL